MELIRKYFPGITEIQSEQLAGMSEAIKEWNQKINVVSRKDIDQLEERHILHSLAIAKFTHFSPGTKIIDVGTGGGLPGLPLAVLYPQCNFTLVDSIAKKIRVVNEIISTTNLKNVKAYQIRAETIREEFDFVISRAVTTFPDFYRWTRSLVSRESKNIIPNGIIYLKGGDLSRELSGFGKRIQVQNISNWFEEEWFIEKKVVFLKI